MRSLLLLLFVFTTTAAFAQSGNDHLLWFKGKLLKPNVLLTSSGDTLVYQPTQGLLKKASAKGSKGRQLDEKLAELNQTPKRIAETVQRLSSLVPKPALPLVAQQVQSSFEAVRSRYEPVLSNRYALPENDFPKPVKTGKGGHQTTEDFIQLLTDSAAILKEFLEQHKGEKVTSDLVPPREEFTYCTPCTPGLEERQANERIGFLGSLLGNDGRYLRLAFGLSRSASLFLSDEQGQPFQDVCTQTVAFVLKRAYERAHYINGRYAGDAHRMGALLSMVFSLERQAQLLGYQPELEFDLSFFAYDLRKYLEKVLDERDYAVALNLNFLLGFDRQFELLFGSSDLNKSLTDRALRFNRFRMDAKITAKISSNGGFQLAELQAQNWFMAVPDSTCRLIWILTEPYVNKLKGKLVATDWRGKGGAITYAGPDTWFSEIPKMRLDFCRADEEAKDTVAIYQFDAEGFDEKWNIPHMGVTKLLAVNNCLMNCFIDVEKVKEEARQFKADPAKLEKMKADMLKQYQQLMKDNKRLSATAPKDYSLLDLGAIARMQAESRKISELIHQPAPGKYVFEPTVHNKEALIVQDRLDGKLLFPENAATEYALFFLKIEHDPKGL